MSSVRKPRKPRKCVTSNKKQQPASVNAAESRIFQEAMARLFGKAGS